MTCRVPVGIDEQLLNDRFGEQAMRQTLFDLCDLIGPRFAGTPGYRLAAQFMSEHFQRSGLQNVRLEPFTFTAWRRDAPARLVLCEPLSRDYDAFAQVYSASTGPEGLAGGLVDVGNGSADLVAAGRAKLPGNFALVIGGSRHRMDIYKDCVEAGARGMLLANGTSGMGLRAGSLTDGIEGAIPAVSIGLEAGLQIQRFNQTQPVKLRLFSHSHCEMDTTWNVVGELIGSESPDELVIVGGHLDSHDIGPGAYDNGAGAVFVMEIARLLAPHRAQLKRTVRFIGFGGEEIGLLGSKAYVRDHEDELLRGGRLMMNCDMPPMNPPWGLSLMRSAELEPVVQALAERMGVSIPIRQVTHGHSDHYPFTLLGIPAVAVAGFGQANLPQKFPHMAGDTPEKITYEPLAAGAVFGARVILRAAVEAEFSTLR